MAPRKTRPKSLKRTAGTRPERRTIVVFSEGKNSEPDYVKGLKSLPHIAKNTALNLELYPEPGVPLPLVKLAVARSTDPEVDECWCVFDVEWPQNHPNLPAAVALAEKNGIKLAISNPCFEIWLILHHQDFTKFSDTVHAEKASKKLDKRAGKSIDASAYMPFRKEAAQRARQLDQRHASDGTTFPHDNPSSGMHLFLRSLEGGETA